MSAEDIQLRFNLGAELMQTPYGTTVTLARYVAQQAWPPTGDYDTTNAGLFKALALNGGRPETSYTTKERIVNDLDETFIVEQESRHGNWLIHRKLRDCPRCHGSGRYRRHLPLKQMPLNLSAEFDPSETVVSYEERKCDHRPVR